MREKGSSKVESLATAKENQVSISEISLSEVAATFAAKARAPRGISSNRREEVLSLFLGDCQEQYRLIAASRTIIDLAVLVTQRRKIRGCDAIQLATALTIEESLFNMGLPPLVFVASDLDLLQAAKEEGLAVENPEHD